MVFMVFNDPNNPSEALTLQPCRPRHGLHGFHGFQPSVCRTGWWATGKPCISSHFSSRAVIWEGTGFAPAIALGLLGINHGCCQLGGLRMPGWGPRTHAMTFCLLLTQGTRGGASAIRKKEGGQKEGGKGD